MKLTGITLLIITVISLSACGGSEDAKGGPAGDDGPTTPNHFTSISEAMDLLVGIGATPKLNRDDDVAGPDADANGVRDDLDAYVASLPDSELQKKAILQSLATIQYVITADTSSEKSVEKGLRLISSSVECLYNRYDLSTAQQRSKDIESYSINTGIRAEAYDRFNKAASGHVISEPDGAPCI